MPSTSTKSPYTVVPIITLIPEGPLLIFLRYFRFHQFQQRFPLLIRRDTGNPPLVHIFDGLSHSIQSGIRESKLLVILAVHPSHDLVPHHRSLYILPSLLPSFFLRLLVLPCHMTAASAACPAASAISCSRCRTRAKATGPLDVATNLNTRNDDEMPNELIKFGR